MTAGPAHTMCHLMERDAFEKLTDQQRACLRLALTMTAKEVGQALGLSHNTVNQHLFAARKTLGFTTTSEAARRLATVEVTSKNLVSYPPAIATRRDLDTLGEPPSFVGPAPSEAPMQDAHPGPSPQPTPRRWFDDLSVLHKLLLIAAIAIAGPVALAGIIVSIRGLAELLQQL